MLVFNNYTPYHEVITDNTLHIIRPRRGLTELKLKAYICTYLHNVHT
jgi:hypothetical protein